MMKPDSSDRKEEPSAGAVARKRALLGVGGGFALVFVTGIIAGFSKATMEHGGPNGTDAAIIAVLALGALAIGYGMWRFWPGVSGEPMAKSTRKATRILYAMCGLGAVMGFAFAITDESGSMALFSNGPVGNVTAALAILGWAVVVPVMTWIWWRTVDEHETAVYAESGLIAAHVYLIGVPTWWLATRAGWLPAQDPMIVWLVVATMWSIIWLYRRYF